MEIKIGDCTHTSVEGTGLVPCLLVHERGLHLRESGIKCYIPICRQVLRTNMGLSARSFVDYILLSLLPTAGGRRDVLRCNSDESASCLNEDAGGLKAEC
jgi:hypothetical protein